MRASVCLAALLTVAACAAVPAERPADEFNQARLCYAERELSGPRPACQGMRFLEAEGRVLESDFARRHLRLEHGPLPGYRPPGAYDYQVYPDYLLEAVAVGDTVRFVVESNSGDVVDVWPLLPGR